MLMALPGLLVSCLFHCLPPAADMISTEVVLRDPFMQETNIKNRNARLGVNLAIAAGSAFLDTKIKNKKIKWSLRIAHVLLGAYAVRHNFLELEKAQRARSQIKQFGAR